MDAEKHTLTTIEKIPAQLSKYLYEVKEPNLQDIDAEESNNNVYIHFDSKKYKPGKNVEVTSFVADSETALKMDVEEAISDVRKRTGGADMISAFFVAPEDEVHENVIDRKKAEKRGDINGQDNYNNEENATPVPQYENSLSEKILAPLQAAVSLSHEESNSPIIEKQNLKEMPVYKTIIEIQKSIPIEIKEVDTEKEEPQHPQTQAPSQQYNENSIIPQLMFAYQIPQYRSPLYYRYPMYYIPQSYIGKYIMRHSHENTGIPAYLYRPRPVPAQQYYYLKYPTGASPVFTQSPSPVIPQPSALQYPVQYTHSGYGLHAPEPAPQPVYPPSYHDNLYQEEYLDQDQNTLHSETVESSAKPNQVEEESQTTSQTQQRSVPFRPSQHVFSSVYPPYTYKVPLMLRGRGLHARSVRSKQLCIEYGGFKPPMIPSQQIDEKVLPQEAEEKSAIEEKSD